MFREGSEGAGENVGVLLRGTKSKVERGQVLCKPGSITPLLQAQVYVLTQKEGGRPWPAYFQQLPPSVLLPHH